MSTRVGKSFADLLDTMRSLIAGLNNSQNNNQIVAAQAQHLNELFQALSILDHQYEEAKANVLTLSATLKEKDKEAREIVSRTISLLEGIHGKRNPELEKYGISRRTTPIRSKAKNSANKTKEV